MGDFGIKVALPGIDVNTAPDYQLLFSSSWPNIKMFKNINIKTSVPVGFSTIFNHGLGFVPAVIPYSTSSFMALTTSPMVEIDATAMNDVYIDNQNIYYDASGPPNTTVNINISLLILFINIEQNYTAPIVNTGNSATLVTDKDFGIKMSKVNKDVSSKDMRDFILHSNARSPMLHAISWGALPLATAGANSTYSYTHNLPYNPIFFAYKQNIGGATTQPTYYSMITTGTGLITKGNTISVSDVYGTNPQNVSIVVLKDPFVINDNVITVSM